MSLWSLLQVRLLPFQALQPFDHNPPALGQRTLVMQQPRVALAQLPLHLLQAPGYSTRSGRGTGTIVPPAQIPVNVKSYGLTLV